TGTITDSIGNFNILVRPKDTLLFSAVQLKRKIVVVTDSIYHRTSYIVVPMKVFVNELQEVIVQPYNLSGSLTQDLNGLKLKKDVSAEALELPNAHVKIITQSENKLHDADHGKFFYYYVVGAAINVNKILNRLSGRTKMLKERVKLDKKYQQTQDVTSSIVDSLFINELRIPREKISDFMYFCEVDTQFQKLVNEENQLSLWEYLLARGELYRKNNGLD
ncbi:MAG: hypothetical protein AB3N10_14865, partial [Allomuricauda sp.]